MLTFLALMFFQAGKIESTPEWKKASDAEGEAVASDRFADWSAAGEAWLAAAKKLRQLPLQERGLGCLEKAWSRAEGANKDFLRTRLRKIAAPPDGYQQAPASSGAPSGWYPVEMAYGASIESRFARTGRAAVKLLPVKEDSQKGVTGWSSVESQKVPVVPGKKYALSMWAFAMDTDQAGEFSISFRDAAGKKLERPVAAIPSDCPIWRKVEFRFEAPAGAVGGLVRVDLRFARGCLWVDDFSMTDESGAELMPNGGFEKR